MYDQIKKTNNAIAQLEAALEQRPNDVAIKINLAGMRKVALCQNSKQ